MAVLKLPGRFGQLCASNFVGIVWKRPFSCSRTVPQRIGSKGQRWLMFSGERADVG